jgi:predicted nucleotidyltransferase
MEIKFIRESADFEKLIKSVCNLILTAFPGEVRAIYLLGSRAAGGGLPTSDIDLAVVFKGPFVEERDREVREFAKSLDRLSPVMLDVTLLAEDEARQGIRPYLRLGRLLTGTEILAQCPLKPAPALIGFYTYTALFFMWVIRGRPVELTYPLEYPSAGGFYRGYDVRGVVTGENEFRPGFNTFVNLIASIANFRLATLAGEFIPSKSRTVEQYQLRLPNDPWQGLVEDVFDQGRDRWGGREPESESGRARLARRCREALAFENECFGTCLLNLPALMAVKDGELNRWLQNVLRRVRSASPAHAAAIAAALGVR